MSPMWDEDHYTAADAMRRAWRAWRNAGEPSPEPQQLNLLPERAECETAGEESEKVRSARIARARERRSRR